MDNFNEGYSKIWKSQNVGHGNMFLIVKNFLLGIGVGPLSFMIGFYFTRSNQKIENAETLMNKLIR